MYHDTHWHMFMGIYVSHTWCLCASCMSALWSSLHSYPASSSTEVRSSQWLQREHPVQWRRLATQRLSCESTLTHTININVSHTCGKVNTHHVNVTLPLHICGNGGHCNMNLGSSRCGWNHSEHLWHQGINGDEKTSRHQCITECEEETSKPAGQW